MADILIADLRAGRNGVDSPTSPDFPDNQCVEALNVSFDKGDVGGTRGGSEAVATTGGTAFASGIYSEFRFVPSGDETAAELWAVDGAGLVKRCVAGVWSNVTLDDAVTGNYGEVNAVTFNGKLFLFYKSAQNRLHVYDPRLGVVRRVGLAPSTAGPTVANQGSGTLTGARYYRVRFLEMNGTTVVRKSEASPASSLFTPSGSGLSARVTQPTPPGERETHWEVEIASSSSGPWYVVAGVDQGSTHIALATTTYDDTTVMTALAALATSDPSGMYSLFPAMRFGIEDNNRIVGCGSFLPASEEHESRVWFSPVLGDSDRGDDERWVNQTDRKTRIDTSEKNGGSIVSIVGPVNGVFWTLKYRQIWRHTPTGDTTVPYLSKRITGVIGSVSHRSSILAEDTDGNAAAYIWSHRGPYRLGMDGLLYLGRDIEDITRGLGAYDGARLNLSATTPVHGLYHSDASEIHWWIPTGSNAVPNLRVRCEIRQALRRDRYGLRGGWRVDTGVVGAALCSTLYADTLSPTSSNLLPHIGTADTKVLRCDVDGVLDDDGTAFQSYILTKSVVPTEESRSRFALGETVMTADASVGHMLRLTAIGDFGISQSTADVALDPLRAESIVIRRFDAAVLTEQGALQLQLGDPVALASEWHVHGLTVPRTKQGAQ